MSVNDALPPTIPEVPEPDGSDIAYGIGRAVLSLIPLPVAPVAEIMIRSPMDKRVDNWRIEITRVVEYLNERLDEVELGALRQSEEFATTFLHATRAAVFTHRKEKHEMLRNALLHSAMADAPEDDEQTTFLNLVEEFSVTHILVLKTFRISPDDKYFLPFSLDNPSWKEDMALDQLFDFVQRQYPEKSFDFQFFLTILPDLHSKGLISNTLSDRHTLSELRHQPGITTFGSRFLKFIESPLDDDTT